MRRQSLAQVNTMKRTLKHDILLIPLLFFIAVLLPVFAWHGVGSLDSDIGEWFQRSGSLVVLCAAVLEYLLFKITLSATPASGERTGRRPHYRVSSTYLKYIQALKYVTAIVAIIGTVIWGYGDLMYQHAR
ncbi:hypothetical protein [Ferrimonas balearica]|uniref:hypothetical protein n=1 Tax=Ferrimonas balearica TaxID=44012 RepID=UPI001C994A2A|nr:hypothetical protein [Ferrimonas balearica]MBY5920584.1 hypothetical protein [Ferrimonas balearica]MBY5996731.1 hypothetical protein [Ferrimonas balearica]